MEAEEEAERTTLSRDLGAAAREATPACGQSHKEAVEAWGVETLIRHLVDEFHVPARRDTPLLLAEMEAARDTMAGGSDVLDELSQLVGEITRDLLDHMEKEENVLFPWIQSGRGKNAHGPIRAMTREHSQSVAQLDRVRELREELLLLNLPLPVVSFLERLEAFELDLREHTRIENDVLFLRALQGW